MHFNNCYFSIKDDERTILSTILSALTEKDEHFWDNRTLEEIKEAVNSLLELTDISEVAYKLAKKDITYCLYHIPSDTFSRIKIYTDDGNYICATNKGYVQVIAASGSFKQYSFTKAELEILDEIFRHNLFNFDPLDYTTFPGKQEFDKITEEKHLTDEESKVIKKYIEQEAYMQKFMLSLINNGNQDKQRLKKYDFIVGSYK